jgi:hypothetical protein
LNARLAVASLAVAGLAAGGASAQDRPLENEGLPRIEDIRPVGSGAGIRDITITIETGLSRTQNVGQPTQLDHVSWQTIVGAKASIGEYFFAGVSGTFSRDTINSTNLAFGLPLDAAGTAVGADLVLGVSPVSNLKLGLIAGLGQGNASYNFTGFPGPATPQNSNTRRLGGFVSASHDFNGWLATGTASVIDMRTEEDFGPLNIPQFDTYGATLFVGDLTMAYRLNSDLTLEGGVAINQVLSQVAPAAQGALDSTWFTLHGGVTYSVTDHVDLTAKASAWMGNEHKSFGRFAVGAAYKF